ncbi:MAG: hypothetical protein H7840_16015 [Alphaproteobacteria bacterium]
MRALRPSVMALALLVMAGCAEAPRHPQHTRLMSTLTPLPPAMAVADAVCEGDFGLARDFSLTALELNPGNRSVELLTLYALDEGGHPAKARDGYQRLAESADDTPTELVCGSRVLYRGRVADVAHFRLLGVERKLAVSGTRPETQDVAVVSPPAPIKAPTPAVSLPTPPSARFFCHLESYRTRATLDAGWLILRKAHKAELEGKAPQVIAVNLGPGRGTYLRLGVGVVGRAAAHDLCDRIKRSGGHCTAMVLP